MYLYKIFQRPFWALGYIGNWAALGYVGSYRLGYVGTLGTWDGILNLGNWVCGYFGTVKIGNGNLGYWALGHLLEYFGISTHGYLGN